MTIAVLTSSRADYGIYLPLLKALHADDFIDLRMLVFGTHLSVKHGYTIKEIKKDGFHIDHEVSHIGENDSPTAIVESMGKVIESFASVWEKESKIYDLVLCLGDRYEMFAAVASAAPFNINFAHLHGGETSLGAIDNEFRHCITIFSKLHFTSTEAYTDRVAELKGERKNIFTVGALSLDNISRIPLLPLSEFETKFGIDLTKPTLLITFHPETAGSISAEHQGNELVSALKNFTGHQLVITMPNADKDGNTLRRLYRDFASENANVKLVENFGTQGYFTCMKNAGAVIGNSSSGIIEAAGFGKWVVNIGDRQKGRAVSKNIINAPSDALQIKSAIEKAITAGDYKGENIYYKNNVAEAIIDKIKEWHQQTNTKTISYR
jgi:GDP/UDP-N,N'-diacetylbacillosamine 2-epimerase (hydrolysing)